MNLKTQCLTQNDGVMLTLDTNSIISYKLSSYQILGDSLFQYDIQPYEFTVRYSVMKAAPYILDEVGCPIPLDEHGILNKYMIYAIDSDYDLKQALYILNDTMQWSDQTDQLKFQAVPMIGVIAKYDSIKPKTIINNIQYNVPRDIKFTSSYTGSAYMYDSPIWYNVAGTMDGKLNTIYGTLAANIITNNGRSGSLWNTYDTYKQYWIDGSKAKLCMKLDDIGYSTLYPSTPMYIHMLQSDNNFRLWDNDIKANVGISTIDIDSHINPYTHRIDMYDPFLGAIRYGQRMAIDCIPDPSGQNFTGIIDRLTDFGYFTWQSGSTPYILTSSEDPGDIIEGQPVIGISIERPDFIYPSCNYYYRNPVNDSIKRRLKLQYWKYAIRYHIVSANGNEYTFNARSICRRCSYYCDPRQPNALGTFIDTGYNWTNQDISVVSPTNEIVMYSPTAQNNIFPQGLPHNYTGSYANDDFIKYYRYSSQDIVKSALRLQTGSYTYDLSYALDPETPTGRLSDYVYINTPLILDTLTFKKDTDLNMTNILKQFMLYTNISIIQKNGITYDSGLKCGYTRRMYNNNLSLIDSSEFYNLDASGLIYVQQYKYTPYIKFKLDDIDKYTQIQFPTAFKSSIKQYYQNIRKNYKYKIAITLIGIWWYTTINISDARYFIFKGKRWICTSYAIDIDNNITKIQGYGG